jgi:hypothetical protein
MEHQLVVLFVLRQQHCLSSSLHWAIATNCVTLLHVDFEEHMTNNV